MGTRAVAKLLSAFASDQGLRDRGNEREGNAENEQPAANTKQFISGLWEHPVDGRISRCRILSVTAAGANIYVGRLFLATIWTELKT